MPQGRCRSCQPIELTNSCQVREQSPQRVGHGAKDSNRTPQMRCGETFLYGRCPSYWNLDSHVHQKKNTAVIGSPRSACLPGWQGPNGAGRRFCCACISAKAKWCLFRLSTPALLAAPVSCRPQDPSDPQGGRHMTDLGVVVVGRNEGQRLARCLTSVLASSAPLI